MSSLSNLIRRLVEYFKQIYREYPNQFWLVMLGTFIDRVGGALMFTFFTLYITAKFDISLTQAGVVFIMFGASGLLSQFVGGALTDRFGRKKVVLFSLVISAMSAMLFWFVQTIEAFYLVAILVGLLADVGGPANQAMVMDMLPEDKRAEGFGIWRVVANIAVVIGPIIGALLVQYSFFYLFLADSVTSVITATLLAIYLRETKPQATAEEEETRESLRQTFQGYGKVLQDRLFLGFVLVSIMMGIVYTQMYTTLAVFLRDYRDFPTSGYGYIMSMNAFMVVTMQFWLTRRTKVYPAFLLMAAGSALYGIGFAIYGFAHAVIWFYVAMAIITLGEMVAVPVASSLVAKFAPEEMRGRYGAIYGLAWQIPGMFGLVAAGLLIEHIGPDETWYIGGVVAMIAALGYVGLYNVVREKQPATPAVPEAVPVQA